MLDQEFLIQAETFRKDAKAVVFPLKQKINALNSCLDEMASINYQIITSTDLDNNILRLNSKLNEVKDIIGANSEFSVLFSQVPSLQSNAITFINTFQEALENG